MKTRLDASHELAYLQKYQGKQFKHKAEIRINGMEPNIYNLGSYDQVNQMVTVHWWLIFDGEPKTQHAVEYKLGEVLKWIIIDDWIILNK